MTGQKRWQEFAAIVIWEGIKILFGIGFAAASVYLIAERQHAQSTLQKHGLLIGVVMGAIGTAILITSYYKLRYHSPLPRQRADFEHLDRSILFEYINTSHCRYRKQSSSVRRVLCPCM